MTMKTAVVIGVGPLRGLGAVLCQTAARAGLHVVVAGRTQAKVDAVAEDIRQAGGAATAISCDTTEEEQVVDLINRAEAIGPIDLAIYNAGNNFNGDFLTMETSFFEKCWRVCTFGGFVFSRQVLKVMVGRQVGT